MKARVAYTDEKDFIEVEMDRNSLTFPALVTLLTRELGVDRKLIYKIRKLPNTILRKDKDVKRLQDFQELEVVLTNKAMSATSRGYGDFSEGYKTEQILYWMSENVPLDNCAQQRFQTASAFVLSDQNLHWIHFE